MKELAAEAAGGPRKRGLYFEDAWSWSREQADALRRRDLGAIDWDNLIEEVEDVGNRHADEWTSYCGNVISHLLKIEHSRGRGRSTTGAGRSSAGAGGCTAGSSRTAA